MNQAQNTLKGKLIVGIDLGTTNSGVAVWDDERGEVVRSLEITPPGSGLATWDGRDERGAIAVDGPYTLAPVGEGGAPFGQKRVEGAGELFLHLLRDRGPLTLREEVGRLLGVAQDVVELVPSV